MANTVTPHKSETLTPIGGVDADASAKDLPSHRARWMKNCEVVNPDGGGLIVGGNGVITPSQSTFTDFPESLLPCTRTWQVSLVNNTFPFYIYGYTVDGVEFVVNNIFGDAAELDAFFVSIGWTKTSSPNTYQITTTQVWQYFSWNPISAGFQNYATCILVNQEALNGNNFAISSYYDERLKQLYWHVYNTANRHWIGLYDAVTGLYQKAVETPLLPCDYDNRIGNNIDLIQATIAVDGEFVTNGRLFYFCSETKFPSKFNIDTCLAGTYFNNFPLNYTTPDEWLRAVKYPPFQRPTIDITQPPDATVTQNNIQRNTFQFRTRFRFDDGEFSKYSPISSLAIPIISQNQTGIANFILLSNMSVGSGIVTHVEINVRIGNTGDWYLYQTLKRSDLITNPIYSYSITDKTFEYKFFNNRQSVVVDQTETGENFDESPIQSGGQEFLTNDTLLYYNILEGYDNLPLSTIKQTNLTVTYTAPISVLLTFSTSWTGGGATPTHFWTVALFLNRGGTEIQLTQFTELGGTSGSITFSYNLINPQLNDEFYLRTTAIEANGDGSIFVFTANTTTFQGVYTNAVPVNNGNFTVDFSANQQLGIGDRIRFDTAVSPNFDPQNTFTFDSLGHSNSTNFDTCPNGSGNNVNGEHLKNGGQYQFEFTMYDEALRSSAAQTWDGLVLNVAHIQDAPQGIKEASVAFNFNGLVLPDWVKYVSIGRTQNLIINRSLELGFIQWEITNVEFFKADGTQSFTPATDAVAYIQFQIFNLGAYNESYQLNTTTVYTWSPGDRIQFISNAGSGGSQTPYTSVIDLQLKSVESINFTVDYNVGLSGLADFSIVEIYTPNAGISDSEVYYEVSDFIPTTRIAGNNKPIVSSVTLDTFDTFIITRIILPTSIAYTYESPSAYDTALVPSNGEDIGRTNVVDVTAAQLWKQSLVRFSLVYNADTFINGLSTFEPDRLRLYPQANGKITKCHAINTILQVIQEVRAQYSLINKQVISLQDGSEQMVAGSQILSDPIDVIGDYGCQNPETFIYRDGTMYYWDLNRGVIVGHVGKEQKAISANGLSAYYLQQSQFIRGTNANNTVPLNQIQIHGGYDPRRKKYYVSSFQYIDANSWIDTSSYIAIQPKSTYAYNMSNGVWESAYGFIPEYYAYVDAGNFGNYMVSFKQGIPYFHNHASAQGYLTFYGDSSDTQYISVVFNRDARDIVETETRTITFGQAVKNYFSCGYDSKLPNNYPSGVKYRGDSVITSNGMTSIIPIGAFLWKEGYYFGQFFGNTSTGLSHINGQQLKGEWCQVVFKRDTSANVANVYNEVSKFIAYFNNSEKTSP